MIAAFAIAQERLGDHVGYVAGFGVYWATCAGVAGAILGRAGLRAAFEDRRPRLGRPALLGLVLLAWPPLGAIATRFIPEIGSATPPMIVTIVGVGIVNALLEELMWRAAYVQLWPNSFWLGCLWPAAGFAAWHLAPQIIHPSAMGPLVYVAASLGLGISWGWVAWRTGSIRWTSVSHVLTDASGLRNAFFFLGA